MSSNEQLVPVEQRHREAAAHRIGVGIDGSPMHYTAARVRDGHFDAHPWVQAFAQFEAALRTPPAVPQKDGVEDAIKAIRHALSFGYKHGLHEFGYDPVDVLVNVMQVRTPPAVEPDEEKQSRVLDTALRASFDSFVEPDEGLVERIAQFLHDEGDFDDAWSGRAWPEHPDDTGQRDGGFVKLVPTDVQAKFREVARRLVAGFNLTPSIRAQALEEAAKVADKVAAEGWKRPYEPVGVTPTTAMNVAGFIAAAIRTLKTGQGA